MDKCLTLSITADQYFNVSTFEDFVPANDFVREGTRGSSSAMRNRKTRPLSVGMTIRPWFNCCNRRRQASCSGKGSKTTCRSSPVRDKLTRRRMAFLDHCPVIPVIAIPRRK